MRENVGFKASIMLRGFVEEQSHTEGGGLRDERQRKKHPHAGPTENDSGQESGYGERNLKHRTGPALILGVVRLFALLLQRVIEKRFVVAAEAGKCEAL